MIGSPATISLLTFAFSQVIGGALVYMYYDRVAKSTSYNSSYNIIFVLFLWLWISIDLPIKAFLYSIPFHAIIPWITEPIAADLYIYKQFGKVRDEDYWTNPQEN